MEPARPPVPFPHPAGPLAGYRVLDLADEKGQLCARLLAELGADVIKVEPPREGDPTRQNGPFFKGEQGPESSLYWWAMNAGKRSVTLQLRLEAGRDILRRLIERSDIVIETTAPGDSAALGYDYAAVCAANPRAILVSITNFGQTGPYARWHATDIVGSAMGGQMFLNGDPGRGPLRTTVPQAYTQANIQGAVGAMIALYARGDSGPGQHVDVSMQAAMALTLDHAQQTWDIRHVNMSGPGVRRNSAGNIGARYLFETADGWVAALRAGGLIGPGAGAIIDWLAAEGEAAGLDAVEWRTKLTTMVPLTEEERDHVEATMAAFCRKRKKEPLVAEAQSRGSGWAPVFGPREIVDSTQLAAREYWVRVAHEDIGESFVYPGAPFKLGVSPWAQRGRAPHIGEHNGEVFTGLLGIEEAELRRLRLKMVV